MGMVGLILLAVLGILPPLMMMLYRSRPAAAGCLCYGRGSKIFLGLLGLTVLAIGVVVPIGLFTSPRPVELSALIIMPVFLLIPAGGLWMLGDVVFIRHHFDVQGIEYRSPWSRHRSIAWASVTAIRWRAAAQWVDFHDAQGGVMHFSTMLVGIAEFSAMALEKVPAAARESSPEAIVILAALTRGQAASLTGMNRL